MRGDLALELECAARTRSSLLVFTACIHNPLQAARELGRQGFWHDSEGRVTIPASTERRQWRTKNAITWRLWGRTIGDSSPMQGETAVWGERRYTLYEPHANTAALTVNGLGRLSCPAQRGDSRARSRQTELQSAPDQNPKRFDMLFRHILPASHLPPSLKRFARYHAPSLPC